MRFALLGPLAVVDDAGGPVSLSGPRLRVLLAALLVHANTPVCAQTLADAVWDGAPPPAAARTLRSYVRRLRRALGPLGAARIVAHEPGYLIRVSPAELDVLEFEALCRDAGTALRAGGWMDASGAAVRALELWRGEPLLDVRSQVLRDAVTSRLETLPMQAIEDRLEADLHLGEHARLVPQLRELTTRHPLAERLAAQYMLVLYRCGRPAEALQHYQHVRDHLAEELGTDPGQRLQELHEQILRNDPHLRIFTATPALSPTPRQLPPPTPHFVGRAEELRRLTALLDTTVGTVVISAIGGTGGIGKTWLALTWSHRNLHRFPDGQLWIDLRGFSPGDPKKTADVLADFLAALGVNRDQQPTDPDARAALYRTLTAGKRLLIVLDNAATPDQVIPLLPGGSSCTVLITSRHRLPALLARHGARPLHLDVLTYPESRALLTAALTIDTPALDIPGTAVDRAVCELIDLCQGFPLALGLIAARIRTHPDLLDEIVTELRELGLDALDSDDADASLPTVLSWSVRQLPDQHRIAFGLLGIAPGPDIDLPAAIHLTGSSEHDTRTVLRGLVDASLLTPAPGGRFAMHDLVRDYAAATARDQVAPPTRRAALARVLDFYRHTR